MKVPEVLINGNHNEIVLWRKEQMLKRTFQRRKDLFKDQFSFQQVRDLECEEWFWDI